MTSVDEKLMVEVYTDNSTAGLLRELVSHLRRHRTELREEWARRITEARLLTAMSKEEIFAEGWLQGDDAWGRPVDVLVMADGSLLVSDDRAGAIYRIASE